MTKQDIIISAAIKMISKKGLKKFTIAETAKEANVTESIIYSYFKGKQDLFFTIQEKLTIEVLEKLLDHLQGIIDPINKLSKMIWFHLHYYSEHREYARLIMFECRSNRAFYKHKVYNLIRKYSGVMLSILEAGVQENVFRADIDMRLLRDIIFGLLDW